MKNALVILFKLFLFIAACVLGIHAFFLILNGPEDIKWTISGLGLIVLACVIMYDNSKNKK